MLTLAVDTSTQSGSVAILSDNKLLGEIYIDNNFTHSETLLTNIDTLLKYVGKNISDIGLFVSSIGPGSFTGIRIGLSLLKGFSCSMNKPLVGVSSIDALAMEYKGEGNFCAFIEGRANEVFYSVFKRDDSEIVKISDYNCAEKDILNNFDRKIGICKSDLLTDNEKGNLFAHNFALLGIRKFNLSNDNSIESNVVPMYLKKTDAELNFV